jgi:hypothetical protein
MPAAFRARRVNVVDAKQLVDRLPFLPPVLLDVLLLFRAPDGDAATRSTSRRCVSSLRASSAGGIGVPFTAISRL